MTGPKYVSGKVLARSILGDPEDFEALSREQTRVMRPAESPTGTPKSEQGLESLGLMSHNSTKLELPHNEPDVHDPVIEIQQALVTLSESRKKESEERLKKLKAMHIFQVEH
jgi:hypothetical protein